MNKLSEEDKKLLYQLYIKVMGKTFLVIYCESSILKYTVFAIPMEKVLCTGVFSQLESVATATLTHKVADMYGNMNILIDNVALKKHMTHTEALEELVQILTEPYTGVVEDITEIKAVSNWELHTNESLKIAVVATDSVKKAIEKELSLTPSIVGVLMEK